MSFTFLLPHQKITNLLVKTKKKKNRTQVLARSLCCSGQVIVLFWPGHCVMFLSYTLPSDNVSLHPEEQVITSLLHSNQYSFLSADASVCSGRISVTIIIGLL